VTVRVALVALAGGLGATARYLIGLALGGPGFPWATLAINLAGSLLLGALVGAGLRRDLHPLALPVLGTGLLGGFTTFSAFSVEAVQLLRAGRPGAALAYALTSTAGGVLAAAGGLAAARSASG